MEQLFGVPMDVLLAVSLGLAGLALGTLVLAALQRPLFLRLALRSAGRRPLQTALVVLGLTLSTVVISTALNTGDTISHTIRSLVARGLGRADEVIVALPRDNRRSPTEYVGALLNGSLLTGQGGYFPESRAEALRAAIAAEPAIAGLTPAIGEQVTVVNRDLQAVQGQVSLLALPPDYPPVFGALLGADGQERRLDRLAPDQVLLNADAAAFLAAEPGSHLGLRTRDGLLALQVADVVASGELGGAQATLYLPLADYQRLTGRPGAINQILVANRGDATTSSRLSGQVSRTLRLALADRAAAGRLFERLRNDAARALVTDLARSADGPARGKLEALREALGQPEVGDDFVALASDPEIERRLLTAAGRLGGAGQRGSGGLPEISPLRVLEVKQLSQEQADRWGGALTSSFLILGLFSLATGALLVCLIFVTLAAERRSELGVMRAVGARRRDLTLTFLLEGTVLNVAASGLGLLLGVALALAITALGDASLRQYGLRLEPHLEWRSLVVAYCLGLLVTFLSIGLSAWYVSRLTVVTAIRNLPDQAPVSRRRLLRPLLPIVLGGLIAWLAAGQRLAGLQVGGILLAIAGAAALLAALLGCWPALARSHQRLAYSLGGLTMLVYSLAPQSWPLVALIRPAPRGLDLLFVTGLGMVFGAVWLLVYNLGSLAAPLVRLSAPARPLGLIVRTAAAYPLQHRLRTGMTLAMFALVIFAMVVAGVLLNATHRAYSDPEATAGGFDLRADLAQPNDLPDFRAALQGLPAVRETDLAGLGRLAVRPAQLLELAASASRWRSYTLAEIDTGFAAGLRAPLAARATGFSDDDAIWRAVLEQPGFAVVAGPATSVASAAPGGAGFRFADLSASRSGFRPPEVWVRDERGGPAFALTVIGIFDPRVSFPAGLYASAASLDRPIPDPQRVSYYLKAREGVEPSALATGLGISLADRGVRASVLGEEVRRLHDLRTLLSQLLQGFFSIGLLAGLAALGVISMRAVVERRQQIGMLRALGFQRQMVRLSFLLEASLLALLGIGLGVGLGLALARRLVDSLGSQYPELVFGVPWQQIGLIALGAYLAALLLTIVPVWQAGRISAADALRYE